MADKRISSIYKILALYEDIDNTESPVTEGAYLTYLDRQYVYWLGEGNADIYDLLKGLWRLGKEAGHKRVKSTVFHIIEIIEREC